MSINHNNKLSELLFYKLDNHEFLRITGGWVHHSYHSLTESKDLFQDIIAIFNQNIIPSNKLGISFIRRISTMASLWCTLIYVVYKKI